MTRARQKDLELRYLDRLRQQLPNFPDGVIDGSGEEPDFRVRGQRTVGIELTELHQPSDGQAKPPQGRQADRDKIVRRAREIYDSQGLPFVDCRVHLKDVSLYPKELESLAQAVAELAARNVPSMGECKEEEPSWTTVASFPDLVDQIRVFRYPDMIESHFFASGTVWVAPLAPQDVQRALNSKEKKYAAYKAKCDEVWLVVVVNAGFMSTWVDGAEPLRGVRFRTPFDRVLVVGGWGPLVELSTSWV
ncbi:MAG TPA: hypothetical protein VGM81_25960 [Burkholderiaceae bacterium]